MLAGKKVVLGVCGGIAAYKVVDLASRLKKSGAEVHVIMTSSATQFVTPLTFQEITGQPVHTSMWDGPKEWNVEHIALATLADLFVIAPATANVIGKMAHGIADDMLTTTILATPAPILVVPAMNTGMYLNPVVQENIRLLTARGFKFMEPGIGRMACGTEGPGRLPEPAEIFAIVEAELQINQSLLKRKVIVTAGGTREAIDPVRYIGNRSSGKMGYAIAIAARDRGADVVLITAAALLNDPPGVRVIHVDSAMQMREAVLNEFSDADIVIKAAAVADYRPVEVAGQKIKKKQDELQLTLVKNPDILKELGEKKTTQILIGFAAETEEIIAHAKEKIRRKNLDMIVANDVTLPGAGFNSDTNIVKLLYYDGRMEDLPQMGKDKLADILLDRVTALLTGRA